MMKAGILRAIIGSFILMISVSVSKADGYSSGKGGMWGVEWGMPVGEAQISYESEMKRNLYRENSNEVIFKNGYLRSDKRYNESLFCSGAFKNGIRTQKHCFAFVGGRLRYAYLLPYSRYQNGFPNYEDAKKYFDQLLEQYRTRHGTSTDTSHYKDYVKSDLKLMDRIFEPSLKEKLETGNYFYEKTWKKIDQGRTNIQLVLSRLFGFGKWRVEVAYSPNEQVAQDLDGLRKAIETEINSADI